MPARLSLFHSTFTLFPPLSPIFISLPMSSSPSPNDQRAIALPESPESLQQARPSAADEIDSLLREGENDEGLSGGSSFSFSPSQVDGWGTPAIVGRPPGLGPMRSNELALVRLLCNKHSFSPYQREELEGLVEHVRLDLFEFCSLLQSF